MEIPNISQAKASTNMSTFQSHLVLLTERTHLGEVPWENTIIVFWNTDFKMSSLRKQNVPRQHLK